MPDFILASRVGDRDLSVRRATLGAVADDLGVVDGDGVTVLDRFLAAGISRGSFDEHLAAGQIAVAGERVTDPAMPAPRPTVAIMLPPA